MKDRSKKNINWCRKPSSKHPIIKSESPVSNKTEGYLASYANGIISIKENGKINASSGEHCLRSILTSGHWPDFLGYTQPVFSLRPIWMDCNPIAWLDSQDEASLHVLSDQIHALGYNALILGGVEEIFVQPIKHLKPRLKRFLKLLNEKNIRLVLNLSGCHNSLQNKNEWINSFESLLQQIQGVPMIVAGSQIEIDGLNWKHGKTYIELLQDDINQFEALLKDEFELIYYLPYCKARIESEPAFLQNLSLNISPKTILAFSAVAGCPTQDYLPAHPFWEELRCMHEVLGIRLLPIVQAADPKWHSFPFDSFESYFSRCYRHRFAGIAAYTSHIPSKEDLNHCNLWVAAQMQWRSLSPALCIETWFKSFRPGFEYSKCLDLFRQIRGITLEINKLSSQSLKSCYQHEEIRLIQETFMSHLKILELKILKINNKCENNKLSEQFDVEMKLFLKSAEKTLLESANQFGFNIYSAR